MQRRGADVLEEVAQTCGDLAVPLEGADQAFIQRSRAQIAVHLKHLQ